VGINQKSINKNHSLRKTKRNGTKSAKENQTKNEGA
jgi:hypothetical protein